MLIALGLWVFRVGWNARIVAMLMETAMVGVLAVSALIVEIAPQPVALLGIEISGRLYLFLLLAAEAAALFWGRKAHRRAATYDPAVAAFYDEDDKDDEATIAEEHARMQRDILDTLTGGGAAPTVPPAEAPEVDRDAIAALAAKKDRSDPDSPS